MGEDLYNKYFHDIKGYKQVTYEEEVKLVHKAQNGDLKAFHKLVTSNLRFVITQAKKFSNQGLDLIDLISVGNIGLMKAIERFDPNKGNKLITYAVWWIRQKIISALAKESRIIRLPLNKTSTASDIIQDFKEQECGTPVIESLKKVCEKYELSEYEVIEVLQLYKQMNANYRDQIFEIDLELIGENFLTEMLDSETTEIVSRKLNVLTDRERFIAENYFALFGDSWTLEMIGEELDLTRERVRQLKVAILKKLKDEISKADFSSKEFVHFSKKESNRKRSTINFNIVEQLIEYKSSDFEVISNNDRVLESAPEEIESDIRNELNEELLMELYEEL